MIELIQPIEQKLQAATYRAIGSWTYYRFLALNKVALMSPKLSICICTYNRAENLKRTLSSLVAQVGIQSELIEVLIVDNNCTDATAEVLQAFRKILPLRCVTERAQGLAHARNRAIAEFSGDVLLFTDDDVRLDKTGCPLIKTPSVAFRRQIILAGAFSRIGGRLSPSGLAMNLCHSSMGFWFGLIMVPRRDFFRQSSQSHSVQALLLDGLYSQRLEASGLTWAREDWRSGGGGN